MLESTVYLEIKTAHPHSDSRAKCDDVARRLGVVLHQPTTSSAPV